MAGGLAPGLKPGTCIIGSSVIDDGEERPTDARWSQRLLRIIPDTVYGPHLGVHEPIAHAGDKCALHEKTGALAVDMESHVVARAAAQHGVPLAVDPRGGRSGGAHHSALGARRRRAPDGTIDPLAVVRSLMRYPRDLIGLIRMSLDARAARATLVHGSALLGPGLGLLDSAPRPAIALALEADTGRHRVARADVTPTKKPGARPGFLRFRVRRPRYSAAVRCTGSRAAAAFAAASCAAFSAAFCAFSALSCVSVFCTCCENTYCAGRWFASEISGAIGPVGLHAEQRDLERLERIA